MKSIGVKWLAGVWLSLLIPTLALGVEIAVEELADGACWAGHSRQGELKVVSFNQGSAFTLMEQWPMQLIYQARQQLTKLAVDPQNVDFTPYLHCSGMGHALVLNLQYEERSFCLWGRWDSKRGEMEQLFLGGNLKPGSAPCWGHRLGELIVGFNGDSEEVIPLLERQELAPLVERVVPITNGVVKVVLHSDYYLLELDALEELKASLGEGVIRYGELNYYQWGAGEFMPIK
jgi:hypothetical protein